MPTSALMLFRRSVGSRKVVVLGLPLMRGRTRLTGARTVSAPLNGLVAV